MDAKGKVLLPDHKAEGLALFATFKASVQVRSGARPTRVGKVTATDAAAANLRRWVSDHHTELAGINQPR